MKLAQRIAHAALAAGASTEIHRRGNGQLVVECRQETTLERRFFGIFVEQDGSLSLMFFRGGQVIKVTGLAMPPGEKE